MNGHIRKSAYFKPNTLLLNSGSGDERNESKTSKASLRTSFVISKRKSSFQIESST